MSMDIEKMFADAAAAAEDTGEKNVGGKETVKKPEPATEQKVAQAAPTQAAPTQPKDNSAEIAAAKAEEERKRQEAANKAEAEKQRQEEERKRQEAERLEEEKRASEQAKRAAISAASNVGLSEVSIGKILQMNKTLEKFDEKQRNFVSGYFQLEEESNDISKVIYKALTASQRDLDALSKIVNSRSLDPAERAFFLMSLDNMVIEDIYEQLDLLTGELGNAGKVNDSNKLNVCRKIESVVSSMQKDIFTYIERLQEFTNIAISE